MPSLLVRFAFAACCIASAHAEALDPVLAPTLAQRFAQSTLPGACAAVVREGRVVHLQAFGYADVAARRPYTVDTLQPVGSVSKTVVGLTLARLAAQGRVDLDAPVARWLDFPLDKTITLRQLATHTSGIVDGDAYDSAYEYGRQRPSRALRDWLAAYLRQPKHFEAAGPYRYSNVGAALAAHVAERAGGQAFDALSRALVLQPLGMARSDWFANDATLYAPDRSPLPRYVLATYPDGGLRTSCADLSRYLVALLQEPDTSLFFDHRADGTVGHTGSDPGVTAFLYIDPRRRSGRALVTNVAIDDDESLKAPFLALWRALAP